MASARHVLMAQLASTGEQLRKARKRLVELKTNPGFWPQNAVEAAQDRVIELQRRYTQISDSYRCICT